MAGSESIEIRDESNHPSIAGNEGILVAWKGRGYLGCIRWKEKANWKGDKTWWLVLNGGKEVSTQLLRAVHEHAKEKGIKYMAFELPCPELRGFLRGAGMKGGSKERVLYKKFSVASVRFEPPVRKSLFSAFKFKKPK
ncbi:MAG: hypothetical protein V1676_05690 [Candidatus Diapherotrites archaeon]